MLRLDLIRLERESEVRLDGEIAPESDIWQGAGLEFDGPVVVRARARALPVGEVLVEGTIGGVRTSQCRRCLDEVERPFDRSFTFYYVPATEDGESDPEVRLLPDKGIELNLEPDIREELIFSLSEYVVCSEDCKGLCPVCGTDLNAGSCDCETSEPDPRWEALRTLRD